MIKIKNFNSSMPGLKKYTLSMKNNTTGEVPNLTFKKDQKYLKNKLMTKYSVPISQRYPEQQL